MSPHNSNTQLDERVTKIEQAFYNDDDLLLCLKYPLSDIIIIRVYNIEKSIRFTNFNGFQEPKIHV